MFQKPARQRRVNWWAEWLANTVLLSLLPILVLLLVCWCISFTGAASAGDLIARAVGGGDVILWAFLVLLPSLACFTRKDSKPLFTLLLIALAGEGVLYILLKILSSLLEPTGGSGWFALVVSVVCGAVSILFSFLGRKRLEENRLRAEPVLSLENADAPREEVPL